MHIWRDQYADTVSFTVQHTMQTSERLNAKESIFPVVWPVMITLKVHGTKRKKNKYVCKVLCYSLNGVTVCFIPESPHDNVLYYTWLFGRLFA